MQSRPHRRDRHSRVTYSYAEIASVGLTETAAREEFGDGVKTVTYDLAGNGKSQILKTSGAVKLVVAPTRGRRGRPHGR